MITISVHIYGSIGKLSTLTRCTCPTKECTLKHLPIPSQLLVLRVVLAWILQDLTNELHYSSETPLCWHMRLVAYLIATSEVPPNTLMLLPFEQDRYHRP